MSPSPGFCVYMTIFGMLFGLAWIGLIATCLNALTHDDARDTVGSLLSLLGLLLLVVYVGAIVGEYSRIGKEFAGKQLEISALQQSIDGPPETIK